MDESQSLVSNAFKTDLSLLNLKTFADRSVSLGQDSYQNWLQSNARIQEIANTALAKSLNSMQTYSTEESLGIRNMNSGIEPNTLLQLMTLLQQKPQA